MSRKTALRGRPVGSGVDDSERLAKISRLIADNPGMKPTTAIRAIGIQDESTIRRLRDKYNSGCQAGRPPATAGTEAPAARSIALRTASGTVRSEQPSLQRAARPIHTHPCNIEALPADAAMPGRDLFAAFYSAGMTTAHLAIQMQFKALSWALEGSPAMCFLRTQAVLDRMLAAANDDSTATSSPIRH